MKWRASLQARFPPDVDPIANFPISVRLGRNAAPIHAK